MPRRYLQGRCALPGRRYISRRTARLLAKRVGFRSPYSGTLHLAPSDMSESKKGTRFSSPIYLENNGSGSLALALFEECSVRNYSIPDFGTPSFQEEPKMCLDGTHMQACRAREMSVVVLSYPSPSLTDLLLQIHPTVPPISPTPMFLCTISLPYLLSPIFLLVRLSTSPPGKFRINHFAYRGLGRLL